MEVKLDNKEIEWILKRGVSEAIVYTELVDMLGSGKPLRLKMGFDPSAPDIHLGHVVGLRKLRQLQDLGHKVVLIVGDWTAQIGDPSGRSQTRPLLTQAEVEQNAHTYMDQFFKVVDKDRTETRWQSEWFGNFSLTDILKLTNRFTVAQFLARDDFAKRFKANYPITITELLYPILQAYDSVAIKSDIEFGGTDQKFNLLVGRDLQQMMGLSSQQCILVPLLQGTDGVQKMSKSLGNYIGVAEHPNEIFGKAMSLPDDLIVKYFDYLTNIGDSELMDMTNTITDEKTNPIQYKLQLAYELVQQFHGQKKALEAKQYFHKTVQRREIPSDAPTFAFNLIRKDKTYAEFMVRAGLAKSSSEAKRLIAQRAVRQNDEIVIGNITAESIRLGDIIRVGRRRIVKIVS